MTAPAPIMRGAVATEDARWRYSCHRVDHGYQTTLSDGGQVVKVHTRFEWPAFDERWQQGLLEYARAAFADPPAGFRVTLVAFDHISLKRETFEPRVDLEPM